jgi:acyl-CoA thioesterase FadM
MPMACWLRIRLGVYSRHADSAGVVTKHLPVEWLADARAPDLMVTKQAIADAMQTARGGTALP